MFNKVIEYFSGSTTADEVAHIPGTFRPPAEMISDEHAAQQRKAEAPVRKTMGALFKAREAMRRERDDIDEQVRILAERSRQLTVSVEAIELALVPLRKEADVLDIREQVVHAVGH